MCIQLNVPKGIEYGVTVVTVIVDWSIQMEKRGAEAYSFVYLLSKIIKTFFYFKLICNFLIIF